MDGVPVGPLPPGELPEDGACRRDAVVERGSADAACALALLERPVDRVGPVEGLHDPLLEIATVGLEGHDASGVGLRDVERRVAVDDPLGEGLAGTRPGEEPDRVESAGGVIVLEVGDLTEVEEAVRREALGAAEEQPDAGLGQDGDTFDHPLVVRAEVVPVLRKGGELRVGRDPAG